MGQSRSAGASSWAKGTVSFEQRQNDRPYRLLLRSQLTSTTNTLEKDEFNIHVNVSMLGAI